jgi:hypothetical protein
MAHKQEEIIFQEYLKQIESGRPVVKILSHNDELDHDTQAELEAAEWLVGRREDCSPRPGFVPASRQRLMARLRAAQTSPAPQTRTWRSRWLAWNSTRPLGLSHNPILLGVLVGILVGLLFESGLSFSRAAHTWLPGDFLYPIKTVSESVSLLVKWTPEQQALSHIEYARLRLLEAQGLVFDGRYEELPRLSSNLNRHVVQAARAINQISGKDDILARELATLLQSTLGRQSRIVALMVQICPESARPDLQRVLAIAQSGMSSVRDVFAPGSGNVDTYVAMLPGRRQVGEW